MTSGRTDRDLATITQESLSGGYKRLVIHEVLLKIFHGYHHLYFKFCSLSLAVRTLKTSTNVFILIINNIPHLPAKYYCKQALRN